MARVRPLLVLVPCIHKKYHAAFIIWGIISTLNVEDWLILISRVFPLELENQSGQVNPVKKLINFVSALKIT